MCIFNTEYTSARQPSFTWQQIQPHLNCLPLSTQNWKPGRCYISGMKNSEEQDSKSGEAEEAAVYTFC